MTDKIISPIKEINESIITFDIPKELENLNL